tara:strand:- start:257 stop:532 length:276 start_codon:yes stop_codon:yes gene_type:complete
MGKLSEAIKAYKESADDSPEEKAAAKVMREMTESFWWETNVGKKFKWPKKSSAYKPFGFSEENGFTTVGNFLIPHWAFDDQVKELHLESKI